MHVKIPSFDFWVSLYRLNPDKFMRLKNAYLRLEVQYAPEVHRAALNELCEMIEIVHIADGYDAATAAFKMMARSSDKLSSAWIDLRSCCDDAIDVLVDKRLSILVEDATNKKGAALTGDELLKLIMTHE